MTVKFLQQLLTKLNQNKNPYTFIKFEIFLFLYKKFNYICTGYLFKEIVTDNIIKNGPGNKTRTHTNYY